MNLATRAISVAVAVLAVVVALPAGAGASPAVPCPSLPPQAAIPARLVQGADLTVCGLAGRTVSANGVEVVIPARGEGVQAEAAGSAGGGFLRVEVGADGKVAVITEEAEAATATTASYNRCTDYSFATTAKFSPTSFSLNSTERRPGNIAKSIFESIALSSFSTWKNGTNSCGLTPALKVPGSLSYGSWTYDANFTLSGGCGTRDGRNVVDWGPLAGGNLGLTCTWLVNGAAVEKDVRLDSSERAWTTGQTGCTTAYDVRSVLTHEFGHALSLGHAAEYGGGDLTMSPNIGACEVSARVLGAGDVRAIQTQYGG